MTFIAGATFGDGGASDHEYLEVDMSFNLAMFLSRSVGGVGVIGGIVGGSAALAKNVKRKSRGEITTKEAVIDTSEEAVGAGVATAFSAFAAGVVGGGLVVSLGTAFTAAALGKYAWDRSVEYAHDKLDKSEDEENLVDWDDGTANELDDGNRELVVSDRDDDEANPNALILDDDQESQTS